MTSRKRTYAPRKRKRVSTNSTLSTSMQLDKDDRSLVDPASFDSVADTNAQRSHQDLPGQLQRAVKYGHNAQHITAYSPSQTVQQLSDVTDSDQPARQPVSSIQPALTPVISPPRRRKKRRRAESPVLQTQEDDHDTELNQDQSHGDHAHAVADEGLSGSSTQLPHLERIQTAFGRHDVTTVQAHTDTKATQATKSLHAKGYARGNEVALSPSAGLHTVAHEAAHVVQQRAGIHLKGGIGEVGDPYEQHADAVADAVVAGHSAEPLLNQMSPAPQGAQTPATQRKPIQCFREVENARGKAEVLQDENLNNADALIEDAGRVEGKFTEILQGIAAGSGANIEKHEVTKKAKNEDGSDKKTQHGRQIYTSKEEKLTKSAPLKKKERINQKVTQKYGGEFGKVLDIVRGTIAYDDCEKLIAGLDFLQQFCGSRDDVQIVRSKQIFQVKGKKSKAKRPSGNLPPGRYADQLAEANVGPSAVAYGDVKVNIAVDGHVCELQFNLVGMLKAKSTKEGHGAYEAMRNLETAWIEQYGDREMPSIDELHARAQDGDPSIRRIEGQLKRAIIASQQAYGGESNKVRQDPKFQAMLEKAESLNP
ncbi:MAG: DUF4157 domain-containing protein [Cyanobacteria bacterium J06627_8]